MKEKKLEMHLVELYQDSCVIKQTYTNQINENFYKGYQKSEMSRNDTISYKILDTTGSRGETQITYAPCYDESCTDVRYKDTMKIKKVNNKIN